MVFNFFKGMYTSEASAIANDFLHKVRLAISPIMNESITGPILNSKIMEVTFGLGGSKAFRLDGFPGLFYKRFWDIVGTDVTLAVKEFFSTGSIPLDFNKTDTVLIPKVKNPKVLPSTDPH